MGIMIAIGIAAPQPARTNTTPATAWLASISPLGYDKAIYDSGAVLGRDEAVVPLSGTTNAPDGVEIEARAVRFNDAADTPTGAATPWATIGTAAGGAWQGNLPVPRAPGTWSRAEVRVKGSTAPAAQMTGRFDAGHVWAMYEQSNWNRVFNITEALWPVSVDDPEAVQIFQVERNPNAPNLGAASRTFVTDATPVTASVVALANVFAAERPGEKLAIAAHVQSGTSPAEMIQEPQTGARKWAYEQATNALITAAGQKVGLVLDMGWVSWNTSPSNAAAILPILTGKEIDGTVRAPGDTTNWGDVLSHDLREFYDYTYTRLTFCGAHGKGVTASKTNWLTQGDQDYEGMIDTWRRVMQDTAHFPEVIYCPNTNDGALRGEDDGTGGWQDSIHHHGHVDWGQNRLARLGMMHALKAAGLVSWPVPAFDRVHYDPAGAHADFWMDGHHVTTERNRMGGASPYVRGWSLDGQILTTAQIVPNAGGSGFAGVRVTPPAGYGPLTYASAIDYGKGELPGFQTYPDDYRNDYVLDLAVIDVGAAGMPALPVRMRSAGELANALPAPASFAVSSTSGPYFVDPNGFGSNTGLLTMRAKMKWTGGGGNGLFLISSNNLTLQRLKDGSIRLAGLKDSSGISLASGLTLNASAPDNVLREIVMTVNLPAQVLSLYVDGSLTDSVALAAGTGQFATGRSIGFFGSGTLPDAQVEVLETWKAYTPDGNTAPLGTPFKRIAATAGGPVETPTLPKWLK